jgi:nitroimidazol reductase NimA-like FMN-containing flavoprotein (pyridoxamine 5'-phosphate oxidase superfamily)
MDAKLQSKVVELLGQHRIMTIATLRPDGWPQATTVGYVNEGLTLWFLCGLQSQKARNLALDNRVSITVDHDTPDIMAITGLSMAARAHPVRDRTEARRALGLLASKYTESSAVMQPMPMSMSAPEDMAVFRVEPEVISVLDYTKGFGHTDLVTLPGSTTEQAKPDKRPPPAST